MDFIMENYVWFIVGGVIILMAIIGFIADKTDFGRKAVKPKPKKVKEKPTKIKVDAKGINELTQNINNEEKLSKKDNNVSNDNEQQIISSINENVDQSLFAPLTETNESNSKEVNTTGLVNEVVNEEPENSQNSNVQLQNIDFPPLPETNNQSVSEEEDIWKF